MRILVTGGTGFIGSRIVDELLVREPAAAIRVLSRRVQDSSRWGRRVEFVQGNVTQHATLPPALAGVDAVVHCVQFPGNPVEDPARGWTYWNVDARGTGNLVAAARATGCRRFVYLSAAGAAARRPEPWLRAKAAAEEAVAASGLPFVILQPTWVYGAGDRAVTAFVRRTRRLPVVPIVGRGTRRVQPIAVADVAGSAARALFLDQASGRTLALGGPDRLTIDEVARTIQRLLGVHRPIVHLPVGLARAVAGLLSGLPSPPVSPGAVDFALTESIADTGEAESLLGMRFQSFEEGLRALLAEERGSRAARG